MQFNSQITVIFNQLNSYAEEQSAGEQDMRCCVIEHRMKQEKLTEGKKKYYALKIIVPGRNLEPYSDLFDNGQALLFRFADKVYEVAQVTSINDFGGKVKYYQLELVEVKSGSES